MGLNRSETLALAGAGLVALAMPLLLLTREASVAAVETPAPLPAPPAPPAPPVLARVYSRALLGGGDAEASAVSADAPELAGIVGRIGSDAVAMVRGADDKIRTLAVGEGVDGWTLESLAIDAAFFTRGGQKVRVPLPAG